MAKRITVTHGGGLKLVASRPGMELITDQPTTEGGDDAGFNPSELLAVSLATCAGFFVIKFFAARQLSTEGLKIEIEYEYANEPRRIGKMKLDITLPDDFPEKYRKAVLRTAETCTVHNTLTHPPEMSIELVN